MSASNSHRAARVKLVLAFPLVCLIVFLIALNDALSAFWQATKEGINDIRKIWRGTI